MGDIFKTVKIQNLKDSLKYFFCFQTASLSSSGVNPLQPTVFGVKLISLREIEKIFFHKHT